MTLLFAPALFDGTHLHGPHIVRIQDGRIAAVTASPAPPPDAERLPDGFVLAPGFVDLQVNGGAGVLFNDAPDEAGLRAIAQAHAARGTTTILPTLISAPRPLIATGIAAVAAAIRSGVPGIAGIHVEGPFLAPSRKGIHPAENLTTPTDADIAALTSAANPPLLLTVAPDVVAQATVARIAASGTRVFLGHTDGTWAECTAALDAGAVGFTHLFNAMSQFLSRAPGAVGACLDHPRAFAGLIADGLHVDWAAVRVAYRVLGPERLVLVSDAMPSVGADAESDAVGFVLSGRRITLRDGRLTDDAGTLAGAHITMAGAVRNMVRHAGVPLAAALRMATATPADAMALSGPGRIAPGGPAHLVALDAALDVRAVWQGGARLAPAPDQTPSVSSA